MQKKYDYIISGAGCAGLSLLVRMLLSGKFNDKRILLIDKEAKNKNDRTWCFWEQHDDIFEPIVYRKWPAIRFHGAHFSKSFNILPYQYKMIRGDDFYNYCFSMIRKYSNVEMMWEEVAEIGTSEKSAWIRYKDETITAEYIFNSILFEKPVMKKGEYFLLQHFKGWTIETKEPIFQQGEATLMDFRVSQQHGTTFVYVMPFSVNRALVEYTSFSEKLLAQEEYDQGLKNYIRQFLTTDDYSVVEDEYGVIPMTNYHFPTSSGNIIYIGTAGGYTKASSGYTFRFIQKKTAALVTGWIQTGIPLPVSAKSEKKFSFYDSVLLQILAEKELEGSDIFTRLFEKNDAIEVFRFLDNESSLSQDLGILASLPTWPFLKTAIKRML